MTSTATLGHWRNGGTAATPWLAAGALVLAVGLGAFFVHPLLGEIRMHHQLIAQLLARLDLTTDEEDGAARIPVSSPALRSVKARKAAQARWRGSA